MKFHQRVLFYLLRLLDDVLPGWSQPVERPGDHLSNESLHYWLTAERHRRTRD